MIKIRDIWCTCRMLYPTSHLVYEYSKNTRNELARPVMGTIFLVLHSVISLIVRMSFLSFDLYCNYEIATRTLSLRVSSDVARGC